MHTNRRLAGRKRSDASRRVAARWGRRGIATLELAMALPVILLLLVALLTLGSAGTALTGATIKARNDAWRARSDVSAADSALRFSRESTTETLVSRTATQQAVVVSPRISLAAANPQHTVLGGSWDHTDLPMDSPPNWDLYPRLGEDLASQLATTLSGVDSIRDLLERIAESLVPEIGNARQMIDQFDGMQGEIAGKARSELEGALNAAKMLLSDLKNKLIGLLDPTEIAKIKDEIEKALDRIKAIEKAAGAL